MQLKPLKRGRGQYCQKFEHGESATKKGIETWLDEGGKGDMVDQRDTIVRLNIEDWRSFNSGQ